MAEMIRSVSDALAGEEFKDTTGLAEREEVNGSSVREHRVYHSSRTSMLLTTRIWAREKVRRLTAGVLM